MCLISTGWDTVKGWQPATVWTAVQAIGVPVALWAAIRLPEINADRQKLEDAVGYRNIAMFSCRMMQIMCERGSENRTWAIDINAYESCLRRLHLVPIEKIGFATISQSMVHIDVLVTKGIMILNLEEVDWKELQKITDEAYVFLRFIDNFLTSNRCAYAEAGSPDLDLMEAPPLNNWWHFRRWLPKRLNRPKADQIFEMFPSDRQRSLDRAAMKKGEQA